MPPDSNSASRYDRDDLAAELLTRDAGHPMNRSVQAAACCALALLATVGCSATTAEISVDAMMANVSSAAKTPSEAPADGLRPGRVEALLLSDDDVSSIVGLPMHGSSRSQVPGAEVTLRDRNDCKALTLSGKDFWTMDFTAYRQVGQQDSDDLNFFTWQGVGAYANGQTASRVFHRTINADLQERCRTATVPAEADEHAEWRVDSLTVTNSRLSVTLSEQRDRQITGWRCSTQIRLQRNVIHRDGACQTGNPSTTAQQMADITANRIGG
ncbi:sensor domain-containing protein [[Mycobacterium] nativiensis]|uniref:Sensor domain-containing protein n=1 Tax=[Mycobacterium] nativiensis TaxID=2855503 RepID=A0ABU5Y5X0_9MYCO|nr:sensor domain-containing protein [Mycolicibacter sp. MYC340]MEB3034355.1 sensor domain-containing protein [Mycolicibacter sp. MYC340]